MRIALILSYLVGTHLKINGLIDSYHKSLYTKDKGWRANMREYDFNQVISDKSPYLVYQSMRVEHSNFQKSESYSPRQKPSLFDWFLTRNKQEIKFKKPSKTNTNK